MGGHDDDDAPPEAVAIGGGSSDNPPTQPSEGPVPVTVITGFLGSGKTTLVRHILTAPHGLRVAVILNEYGEGVEDAYYQDIQGLRGSDGAWIELANGCMCCSVKSEFVAALETLLAGNKRPDYILIETTGMANPGPVASALWTDEEVEAGVQLDGIVTVVDGLNINRQLHDRRAPGTVNEAQVQVAYADLVLLNKMDLCGEEAVATAEADIRAINSAVSIIRTTRCEVDVAHLLHRQGYKAGADVALEPIAEGGDTDDEGLEEEEEEEGADGAGAGDESPQRGAAAGSPDVPDSDASDPPAVTPPPGALLRASLARSSTGAGSSHGGGHHTRAVSLTLDPLGSGDEGAFGSVRNSHDPQIQTLTLASHNPLDLDKVKAFVDRLLWDRDTHPEDIYRVKGVLSIQGDDRKHMLQAVYELYNISPSATWQEGEARVSRVVVIGRRLNKAVLQTWFEATTAAP